MRHVERFDVVIAGGGPAGLSAALVLGRARQRVLVVDAGAPANAAGDGVGVGGLLGHPADVPASALRASARAQLRELDGVTVRAGQVHGARRIPCGFAVDLGAGVRAPARALLLAGGLRYVPPPVPGLEPLWGRSVFHCSFCDGWELRDRALAVVADGAAGVRRGMLLRALSDDVLVIGRLSVADRAELAAAGVRTTDRRIARLEAHDARGLLRRIHFADGSAELRDALFVAPRLERHDALAERLGCAPRPGAPALVSTDADGRTSVLGVYAAGDLASAERSVANAIAAGARTARRIVLDGLRPAGAAPSPTMTPYAAAAPGRPSSRMSWEASA